MKKLPTLGRKKVQVSGGELVSFEPLFAAPGPYEGRPLPLLAQPARPGVAVDLESWAADHRDELDERLHASGGILFRGFGIDSVDRFQAVVKAAAGDPLEYRQQATPRSQVEGRVYTSTDYPADQTIELHNESCYARTFPRRIFFFCVQPAGSGGETPIADSRQVFRELDPELRRRFAQHGVMYVRNFGAGLGLDWRSTFGVDDRDALEALCREEDVEVEWGEDGRLTTRQVRPAVVDHPVTGEPIWFNQAVAFHLSTLDTSLRQELEAQFGERGVPKNVFYGDGSPIDDEVLARVRQAYQRATVAFPWQLGDMLMLDNMLVAHGRRPYAGPRKIVVAMAQPHTLEQVPV